MENSLAELNLGTVISDLKDRIPFTSRQMETLDGTNTSQNKKNLLVEYLVRHPRQTHAYTGLITALEAAGHHRAATDLHTATTDYNYSKST